MKYAELIVKYYSEHTTLIQGDYKTTIPIYGSQVYFWFINKVFLV